MNHSLLVFVSAAAMAASALACSSSSDDVVPDAGGHDATQGTDSTTPIDSSTPVDSSSPVDSATPVDSAAVDSGADASALSFKSDVYSIIGGHCVFCHGPLPDGGPGSGIEFGNLDMESATIAYGNLVGDGGGVPARGKACGALGDAGLLRVDPGNAADSLIYNKLSSNDGDGGSKTLPDGGKVVLCGNPMPLHEDALPTVDLTAIQTWINEGAQP